MVIFSPHQKILSYRWVLLIYMNVVVLCQVLKQKSTFNIYYWSFSDYVLGEKCECFVFNFVVVMVLALPIVQSSLCFFFLSNPPHPTNVKRLDSNKLWL